MFSLFRQQSQDDNFEKILSELEDKIVKSEIDLSGIKVRERTVLESWIYYSIPTYAVILLGYFTTFSPANDPIDIWFYKTLVVLIFPLMYVLLQPQIDNHLYTYYTYFITTERNVNRRSLLSLLVLMIIFYRIYYIRKAIIHYYRTKKKLESE